MPSAWSQEEVEATVQDYLDMLSLELRGEPYNKAEHNRQLQQRLQDRSHGAVEFKHQNVSAVLDSLGLPYIPGYKPRGNVQALLRDVVRERAQPLLDQLARDVAAPQERVVLDNVLGILVEPPKRDLVARDERPEYVAVVGPAKPIDYLQQEARNQSLGDAGEALVMAYEQARLRRAGKDHLARNVEQVSKTQGDHVGYDIRSYDDRDQDRFVEVKTTRYGKLTPFYISANEVRFSKANHRAYALYRVFDFPRRPKLFALPGNVETHVQLSAVNYRAHF